jgi:hypothetical protein
MNIGWTGAVSARKIPLRNAMYERAASGVPAVADIPPIERYTDIYQERRREWGWSLYRAVGIQRGDRVASHQQARWQGHHGYQSAHLAISCRVFQESSD